jgi:Arc/MetJ-type ribon-helix-helix transcriptional regulator
MPVAMIRDARSLAKKEKRSMSELVREAVRRYQVEMRRKEDEERARWVDRIIEEAQREEAEHPMTDEEFTRESLRLAEIGARQARKLGIDTSDQGIVRLIHEYRAKRNA